MSQLTAADWLFWRLVLAISAATVGALVAVSFKKVGHLGLCVLISFAAGALLGVSFFHILPESYEIAGPVGATISILLGYVFFLLLTRFVYHVCPACSATHTEVKFKALTTSMVVALSVHSAMDGLAIFSGAHTGHGTGLAILLAVAYHKFPEGMALTLVAIGSGMSRQKAFLITLLLEAVTTLAGGMVGFLFPIQEHAQWAGYILGCVGGGFVFLVFHALLGEVVKHHPKHSILAAVAGGLSIYCVQIFVH